MLKYETPRITYEKLTLFERIADRCWAGDTIPINDLTEDPVDKEIEGYIKVKKHKNCGDDEMQDFICQLRSIITDPVKYNKFIAQNRCKFKQNTKTDSWSYKS